MSRKTNPLTWLAVALVLAIGLMTAFGALTMTRYEAYYGMMGGTWAWGLVMMMVPGAILVLVLYAALGGLNARPPAPAGAPTPSQLLSILDERYARGEVTREDYLKIRDDLSRGPSRS